MPKTIEGICKLCGKYGKLTFEHVPPASAFNNTAVLNYPPEVTVEMLSGSNGRMPWDFSGLSGKVNQCGAGGYYLCNECNYNTGKWYISEYVKLANTFHEIIETEHFFNWRCSFFSLNWSVSAESLKSHYDDVL